MVCPQDRHGQRLADGHRAACAAGDEEKERASEFAPGTLRKFSLDFISAKVQPEVDRNANASKSVRAVHFKT
jgi:hypothetical protein